MPPTLSIFIVGPGGSLHSRKASELAQDPFPQELYPPLKARTWQGTRLPMAHGRPGHTRRSRRACVQKTQLLPRNPTWTGRDLFPKRKA